MSTEPETTEEAGPGTPDSPDTGTGETPGRTGAAGAGPAGEPEPAAGGAAEPAGGEGDARAEGAADAAAVGQGAAGSGDGGARPAEEAAGGRDARAETAGGGTAGDATRGSAGAAERATDDRGADAGAAGGETAEGATSGGDATAGGLAGDRGAGAEITGGEAEADGAAVAAGGGDGGSQLSEVEAELAAQRVERERIEQRKAAKKGPVESGTKLSGKAADLLAAVRAVESGQKPAATVFEEPAPAPRRPAPEPVRRPQPAPPAPGPAPAAPGAEAVEAVRRVLAEGGAPESLAAQAAAALGEGAGTVLREDPWQLLRLGGVRPDQADAFARALPGAAAGPDDERRGRAVTVWLLEQAALAGHTALELPALKAALDRQGVPGADAAVQGALAEGEALAFQDALEEPGAPAPQEEEDGEAERPARVLVGLERYALAEESLADGLARLVTSVPKEDGSAAGWEAAAGSARGSAAELIRAVAGHALVLHTGAEASRGEAARLLDAARGLGLRAWAATHSPLGREAFARLLPGGESGPEPVATVAGLLSGAEGPGRDTDGALDLDLLVVLDAPQLDVESAAMLAESLPDGARLVLSGDPAVLWSAGAGRVFADLAAARVCPQVASRTPDTGPLGELVSGIGAGELNQVEAPGKEIVIVPVRDAGEAVHRTVQLVADSVPRAIGVPPEQTVVITPGHGGAAGTRALNAALKERLNPGPGRFGGFDPGDRIAYSPAPGRTLPGRVTGAGADGLHLECAGAPVVVPRERVEQSVRHGWALTAHQAVGGRWPAAVVVLPGDAAQTLSRPWVYTAFGRAERHLSVVHGVEQALPRAVAEVLAKPRTTRLQTLLRTQVPAAG
ncbi:DNA helicase RecD [Streptomyces bungoensis]|uniref:DNA helicase RecD n=1 Tax=Streptomyces bungoensis TaxID=285568 RepID=A0A101T399_9ACTN|nr:helix-hairpin-helix domain-containing protein [Streptomyces bungoensis]KUN84939.1 DNA helicase RecD [Streptomyces bungoensis]